jgi:mono/diheme cytochrome c family protein
MKKNQMFLRCASALVGVCVIGLGLTLAYAAPPEKKIEPKKTEQKKLTGAELYAINCNRCHAERYAMEWNSAQWKTLMTHMRVRANIPAAQAKEILKYLQEDSGN